MKKLQLQLWHPIAGFILAKILEGLNRILLIRTQYWPLADEIIELCQEGFLLLFLYIIIRDIIRAIRRRIARRNSENAEELEHQREIERKEIEMVRKSNEILLNLIQDEHREKEN